MQCLFRLLPSAFCPGFLMMSIAAVGQSLEGRSVNEDSHGREKSDAMGKPDRT